MPQINRLSGMGVPIRKDPFFPSAEFTGHEFTGSLSLAFTPQSIVDPAYEFTGSLSLAFTPQSVVTFDIGLPYSVLANVFIDGVNYSSVLDGVVNVTRQDNAAANFEITIKESVKKPAEFLNKIITIDFQAADSTGQAVDYIPIFKGLIKGVSLNESTKTMMTLRGYDYLGVQNTLGEFVTQDITTVKEGSLWVTGTGAYSTGEAPIWSVKIDDETREDIVDGVDWFADTLTGEIIVPVSSNFNNTPGGLKYSYAEPFDSLEAMMEFIAAIKGWSFELDGLALVDYTVPAKQPVLTLSDESVGDIIAKFLELSGGKLEGNLFPKMRMYSELTNLLGADNHVLTESDYYDESLNIEADIDGLLNEQTVRSVAKTYANIEIGTSELLKEDSGSILNHIIFDLAAGTLTGGLGNFWTVSVGPRIIAEVTISKRNIFSISHTASGQFYPIGAEPFDIDDTDWTQSIKDNDVVFELKALPLLIVVWHKGWRLWVYTPGAEWTLQINGQRIEYGGGVVEQTVEVTSTRPVTGISATLKGDVYEHPWLETAAHGNNLSNAILTEAGNFYSTSCERPLHMVKTMQIGDKVNFKRDGDTIFKGLVKTLVYNIDTATAEAPVGIEAKGMGFNI